MKHVWNVYEDICGWLAKARGHWFKDWAIGVKDVSFENYRSSFKN